MHHQTSGNSGAKADADELAAVSPLKPAEIEEVVFPPPPTEFRRFQALYELSVAMTAEHSLEQSLGVLCERVRELLGFDTSFIALRDRPASDFHISLVSGFKTSEFRNLRLPFRTLLDTEHPTPGEVRFVRDYAADFRKPNRKAIQAEGLVSGLVAPILTDAVVAGALCVFNRGSCSFSQPVIDTLSLFSNLAAVEISRKRAEEELSKARDALDKGEEERTAEVLAVRERLKQEAAERGDQVEALEVEKKRLQALSERAPFGIAMVGNEGGFSYVNPKFEELFGYPPQEIRDIKSWFRHVLPETDRRKQVQSEWRKKLRLSKPGEEWTDSFIVSCRGGSKKIVNLRSVRLDSENIMLTCADITQQETVVEALRTSKEKYESLFASMFDAFAYHKVVMAPDGKPTDFIFRDVNSAFEKLFDLKREQIVGKCFTEVVPQIKESSFDWIGTYGKVALTGEDTKFVQYFEPLEKWLSVSAYSPNRGFFVAIIEDITDRKLAEQQIEQQSEFLANVFGSLTHPFYVLDAENFEIIMANDAAGEGAVGTTCHKLFHSRDVPCSDEDPICPLREIKRSKQPVTTEHVHQDVKGNRRFVEVHGYPLFDGKGRVTRMIQYYLDITERKKAQQLLLESERLKAIGEIATGVAHNFNNLLQVVSSRTEIAAMRLHAGKLNEAQGALANALEALQLGTQTVRRLQDFARTRGRTAGPDRAVFDLTDTVTQAIEMSRTWWEEKTKKERIVIHLREQVQPGCYIEAKSSELLEVAVNLIKNAVEALPEGGAITVLTNVEKGSVVFSVTDTGIGIAADQLIKVFEPFWSTKGSKGTGMGLASSYGIVKSYNGEITVSSKPGEGSTFTVRFPLAPVSAPLEKTPPL
jgi:PAS domain S-box-containing protein